MESIFRTSSNKDIIEEIASLLNLHSIIYRIVDNEKYFDPSFITNLVRIHYHTLVADDDFEFANKAFSDYYT